MSFLERLKQRVETDLLAKQRSENELKILKQADEASQRQREAQEREFHQERRQQTESFRSQSRIESLLLEIDRLIKLDPTKNEPKGCHATLFGGDSVDSIRISPKEQQKWYPLENIRSTARAAVGGFMYKGLNYDPEFDKDAIFDVIICGSSEYGVVNEPERSEHSDYFLVVETKPVGDIIFHSVESSDYGYKKIRDIIPRASWSNDRGILEDTLEIAFNRPHLSVSHIIDRSGAKPGWTGGFTG